MKRFVFETTQGKVLEATDEAALMDYARIRGNAARPCILISLMTLGFGVYFACKADWKTGLYTVMVGLLLVGFFWIPMVRAKRFKEGVRQNRLQRENLTNTVRAKMIRFCLEGDTCRMMDGKGAEIRAWNAVNMSEVRESDSVYWLPIEDTAVLLPKDSMKEGTEDEFREWLRQHSKRYRRLHITERMRSSMER